MDPNILKNLGLDSKMNSNDLNLINQILSSTNGGNNVPKMSVKDRNNLISKLSSVVTLSELPQKDIKDMNEEEKKIYREELKKKLKNKQNEQKMLRTKNIVKNNIVTNKSNNNNNYNDTLNKLSEMMKNIPNDILVQNEQINNSICLSGEHVINDVVINNISIDDKINNIINKNYEKTNNSNTVNQSDDLNDYII